MTTYLAKISATLIVMLCLYSCSTTKLPLCPKLSKDNPSSTLGISQTLYAICLERNIKITVLSSTVGEFKGSKRQIRWLSNNYYIIICDFDQSSVVNDQAIFGACMNNSKKWIQVIKGKNPETLMLDEIYCSICCK